MCAKWRISVAVACLVPVVLASVGGCATRYRDMGSSGGGYFDYRLTEDVFSVSFRGNTSTYEELVDLYLLRRSAEATDGPLSRPAKSGLVTLPPARAQAAMAALRASHPGRLRPRSLPAGP